MSSPMSVGFRISPQQRRLWLLRQDDALSPFRVQAAVRVTGTLDRERLEQAIGVVVRRHEILRTSFASAPGMTEALQVVAADAAPEVRALDASCLDAAGAERLLGDVLLDERTRPLAASPASPLRIALLARSPSEHTLVLAAPALCADAASLDHLVSEIAAAYGALAGGPAMSPADLQYADVAEVLNDLLESAETSDGRRRWEDVERAGLEAPAGLYTPALIRSTCDRRLDAAAAAFAANASCSPAAPWLAGFALLLARRGFAGKAVGVACDGRSHPDLKVLPGPFARCLPIELPLRAEMTFSGAAAAATRALAEAETWQDFFGWQGNGYGQAQRYLANTFSYAGPAVHQTAGGLTFAVTSRFACLDRSTLHLAVDLAGDSAELQVLYDPEAVSADDALAFADQYAWLMGQALAAPSTALDEIEVVGPDERRRLLVDWNDTAHAVEHRSRCLHSLIEEQAARTPERTAVIADEGSLLYGELDRNAERLASHLRGRGLRPGDVAGICLERSLEMVVSLLAVLKAGAAFLPLDPDYPPERLSAMTSDARLAAVITRPWLAPRLGASGVPLLQPDVPPEETGGKDPPARRRPTAPDELAYVIFTSGSTGRPKGVMVSHRAIVNRLLWMQENLPLTAADRVLHKTPFSFDASIWEIFAPLLAGAELVLARPAGHQDPAYLVATMARREVTVAQFVPSLLRYVLDQPELARCTHLRRVFCGGEALPQELRQRFLETVPAELYNLYGPTEVAIDATWERCLPETGQKPPTIGRPIANARVYVLDAAARLVPTGAPGELHVAGLGLARGYAGRPDWTAERFLPDPFAAAPGGRRRYRTGDLVRYRRDATIEYLGRADRQLKVRGIRVEPGEIESTLERHPAIARAVAMARHDVPGESRLVVYLVMRSEVVTDADLRAFAIEQLPAHMVPALFIRLSRLPLTPSGKVDFAAFPAPDSSRPALARELVAPATPAERILAEVWAEVLHLDRVGVHDDFFELGGDSIRSIQILAAARKRGLDFTVQALFKHRTIRALTASLPDPGEPVPIAEVPPFSLISEDDRRKLPPDVEDAFPLTFLQAGMLFHSELDRESPIYHDHIDIHLRMELDLTALREALRRLVSRHTILRTSFHPSGFSEPLQLVHRHVDVDIEVDDLTGLPAAEQARVIAAWKDADRRRPFSWTRYPLMRFHLHLRGDDEFNLTCAKHHILMDGWSNATLLTELFRVYVAIATATGEAMLEPPAVDFRHFVALEQEAIASPASRQFWERQLAGLTPLRLPRWPGAGGGDALQLHQFDSILHPRVVEGLRQVARHAEVPLKSVLLSAHLRVLSRLAGRTDVVTGLVSTGRPEQVGGERILGLFLNALPFRLDLAGGTWSELIAQVFAAEREMLPHRRYPLAEVQRRLGGETLLETDFNYLHYHVLEEVERLAGGGINVLSMDYFEYTNFALSVTFGLIAHGSALSFSLAVNPRVVEKSRFQRMAGYYLRALAAIAEAPHGRYDEVLLLDEAERAQLLREWHGLPYADAGEDHCLHQRVAAQARRTPERVALRFAGGTWTYGELAQRTLSLAVRLRRLGVGRGDLVGIHLDRSPHLVVAMLAVLEQGAAFLPLDPSYPPQRLAFMASDAHLAAILTNLGQSAPFAPAVPVLAPVSPEPLETAAAEDAAAASRPHRPGLADLAYVIYTSGSTGRPKGVLVPHRAIANRLLWMQEAWPLAAGDRVLHKTPYGFDAALWEIFVPLLAGAEVVIARPGGHQEPSYLVETMASQQVTVVQLVPTLLRLVLDEPGLARCHSLRRVFCGGERLPPDLRRLCIAYLPAAALYNLYGPTEAAIDVAAERCRREDRTATIGRPIFNTSLYVLDCFQMPLPVGAPGELHAAGAGLAWGYLGHPELTAARFVPDPFAAADEPGRRMYRTGDLARHLPDGTLEHLGRIDHQVKVRGVRVELGEIEAVLAEHPAVREACVGAWEDAGSGGPRLVAYLAAAEGLEIDLADLRDWLRDRLPLPMQPTSWTVLEALPRMPSGKLDRAALPDPAASQETSTNFVAPRTSLEELIAMVWAQVLRRDQVGAHDDFFALGGHSLLATQAVSRLRDAVRREVPLRFLFEAPTVASFAGRVEELLRGHQVLPTPPLMRVPRQGALPLSFAQQRLWFLHQLEPSNTVYNLASAILVTGDLDVAALRLAFGEVVRRHEVLRTTFREAGGEPYQWIGEPGPIRLPVIDLRALPPAARAAAARNLAREESDLAFDLACGPLLRTALIQIDAAQRVLLLTLHHIVSDLWSSAIFVREVLAGYRAFSLGRGPELPELPIQYADYAAWQRGWLGGEALAALVEYWRRDLAGAPPALALPVDRPRRTDGRHRGAELLFQVPAALAEELRRQARDLGATPFMTLLAAFGLLLSRVSDMDDVTLGSPIANRGHTDIEGLIGFFVNTLVLRVRLEAGLTWRDLLGRVRETSLGAFAHQDMPFEKLVEELQPERDLARTPLFQVMLGFEQSNAIAADLPGLELNNFEVDRGQALFDLSLLLVDSGDHFDASLYYNSDLFDPASAQRLRDGFLTLLASIGAGPERGIGELRLMGDAARHQILHEWNDTACAAGRAETFVSRFARIAGRLPHRRAVASEQGAIDYDQLNRLANRMARGLKRRGVGSYTLVALLMERGEDLVQAILGVLKAGAAFLPLNPRDPEARWRLIIEQSDVALLVVSPALAAAGAAPGRGAACRMACCEELLAGELDDANPPWAAADPDDLAYCLFTSGSTGVPKGALITHQGMFNHLLWKVEGLALGPDDVVAQTAAQSVDISIWQMLAPLCVGATAAIVADDVVGDPWLLWSAAVERGITVLELVPSMLSAVVETAAPPAATGRPALRLLMSTGEALSAPLAARCLARFQGVSMVNAYGPTECSDDVADFALDADPVSLNGSVPVGRPIANLRLYVLDHGFRPVPIGTAGKLFVGGTGVGRGYHLRPELPAAVFVPDPFAGTPGERLYDTGDLARFLPDGRLDFLGRTDSQAKIRGHRVEAGEVEALLALHPRLRQAAVLVMADFGDLHLVAYVVPRVSPAPTVAELRDHLCAYLPEAVVPSQFVTMEALPTNTAGKLDRKALPRPDRPPRPSERRIVAPRNDVEALVAEIWVSHLHREHVDVLENFFDAGGHSLLAMQIAARLRDTFQCAVPVRNIFTHPTVAGLAAALVAQDPRPGRVEKIARAVLQVRALSPAEVQEMLQRTGEASRAAGRGDPGEDAT
jgi:amino acid adenylation domain-containing protein